MLAALDTDFPPDTAGRAIGRSAAAGMEQRIHRKKVPVNTGGFQLQIRISGTGARLLFRAGKRTGHIRMANETLRQTKVCVA